MIIPLVYIRNPQLVLLALSSVEVSDIEVPTFRNYLHTSTGMPRLSNRCALAATARTLNTNSFRDSRV